MKRVQAVMKRKRKTVDESGSSAKFVYGVTTLSNRSWSVLKSSILFCKSRMLRKKSFDISDAGFMMRAGARGGPFIWYDELLAGVAADGG